MLAFSTRQCATLPVNLQIGVIVKLRSTAWKEWCWPSNGHSELHLYINYTNACVSIFLQTFGFLLAHWLVLLNSCALKLLHDGVYLFRNHLEPDVSIFFTSEISTINRCIVLCSSVAVLFMVKLCVYKSVLILRATSGLNFAASCSHLKENVTGLDYLWIIKYLYFTNLLLPLPNKCVVGQ